MKLVIAYEEDGKAVSDFKLNEWVNELIEDLNDAEILGEDNTIYRIISNATLWDTIRLKILYEEIPYDIVELHYKDKIYYLNENASIKNVPTGTFIHDIHMNLIKQILDKIQMPNK